MCRLALNGPKDLSYSKHLQTLAIGSLNLAYLPGTVKNEGLRQLHDGNNIQTSAVKHRNGVACSMIGLAALR